MNELQAKAIQAATRFCERRGYEILATQWEGPDGQTADIVADDEGTICFIDVTATDHSEGGFAAATPSAPHGSWRRPAGWPSTAPRGT